MINGPLNGHFLYPPLTILQRPLVSGSGAAGSGMFSIFESNREGLVVTSLG